MPKCKVLIYKENIKGLFMLGNFLPSSGQFFAQRAIFCSAGNFLLSGQFFAQRAIFCPVSITNQFNKRIFTQSKYAGFTIDFETRASGFLATGFNF
ncbi:hypothetical protein [Shewanella chilikensis]|uniref:hypothetical protein n=1 Tax=Shewanella chilikensis TaxID=558541 RepID=UPI00399B4A11